MKKQTITVLGSTGSIGVSTLDVIARHPNRFEIFALTGHRQIQKLAEQCLAFHPRYAVVADEDAAKQLRVLLTQKQLKTEVLHGQQALIEVASDTEVDGVMAAIVGAAGLPATLAAAQKGKTIYLANKETLVVAGDLFMQTAKNNHARILPVDSEHNAIFQSLPHNYTGNPDEHGISSIILTASGGPFLHTLLTQFSSITPAQAVKHPNWSMGQKISIDSATMMNKGLELIEARWLFNCLPQNLEVVIHPQSVIHSMVRYTDGSVLAQMGTPDMRTPIAHCLGFPERIHSGVNALDFFQLNALTFEKPDMQRFPCLQLAYDAMNMAGNAPCILNAANEIAVAAFLQNKIKFTEIASTVQYCLDTMEISGSFNNLESLIECDQATRRLAENRIGQTQ